MTKWNQHNPIQTNPDRFKVDFLNRKVH